MTLEEWRMMWKTRVSMVKSPMNSHSPIPTVASSAWIDSSTKLFILSLLSWIASNTLGGVTLCAYLVTYSWYSYIWKLCCLVKTLSHSSRQKNLTNSQANIAVSWKITYLKKIKFCLFRLLALCLSLSALRRRSMFWKNKPQARVSFC